MMRTCSACIKAIWLGLLGSGPLLIFLSGVRTGTVVSGPTTGAQLGGRMGRPAEGIDVEPPPAAKKASRSQEDMSFVGYVRALPLQQFLEDQLKTGCCLEETPVSFLPCQSAGVLDASKLVDTSALLVVPDTPAPQVHAIFHQLGVKVIFVKRQGKLAGMVTKKSFLHFLEHGHDLLHQPSASHHTITVHSILALNDCPVLCLASFET
eukprot:s4400_g3.t1